MRYICSQSRRCVNRMCCFRLPTRQEGDGKSELTFICPYPNSGFREIKMVKAEYKEGERK